MTGIALLRFVLGNERGVGVRELPFFNSAFNLEIGPFVLLSVLSEPKLRVKGAHTKFRILLVNYHRDLYF